MTTDFDSLLATWDSMFLNSVDPTRERRMEAILAVVGTSSHPPFRILDLEPIRIPTLPLTFDLCLG